MNFVNFKNAVATQFAKMSQYPLLTVETKDRNELFEIYLKAFPEGSNPIYKTRTEHDCNCCKQFIRMMGDTVTFIDGNLVSIWDVTIDGEPEYQAVADAMAMAIRGRKINDYFLHYEKGVGISKNFEMTAGSPIEHHHFSVNLPTSVIVNKDLIAKAKGDTKTSAGVLQRSLDDFTIDGIDTVLELINGNNLYRGKEDKFVVDSLRKLLVEYGKLTKIRSKEAFALMTAASKKYPESVMRAYGTLIGDIILVASIDGDIEQAVKAYETFKGGANYKRPNSLVTPKQKEAAKKKIIELGLETALDRRYAQVGDIKVTDLLFVDRSIAKAVGALDDFFEGIATKTTEKPKKFDNVEKISLENFLAGVLPNVSGVEVFVKNENVGNLVSLITATDPTARNMFKWDNPFSWSYNGDFADSTLKERVKLAGGSVVGDLCCRLGWGNRTDLDFHMMEPGGSKIYFGNRSRASVNGGKLDVDANGGSGMMENPVENIFYAKLSTMRPGIYELIVDNYSDRTQSGQSREYTVEVDMMGQTFSMTDDFTPGMRKTVARFEVKDGKIELMKNSLLSASGNGKEVWGIQTGEFVKCNAIMNSPNFWGDNESGNKHLFFMLDKCVNEGSARGFYNEYLIGDLHEHRKTLEIVAAKKRTQEADNQLSGLGFSYTGKQEVLVRVTGKTQRMYKVFF